MGILYTTAFALSLFSPQGPGTGPAFEMADLLPRESLVAVGINSCEAHEEAIRETGLVKILERVMADGDIGTQMQLGLMQFEMMSGLSADQLKSVFSNGMAFSWTGLDQNDNPDWVAVVNIGENNRVVGETLDRLIEMAKTQASVRSDLWENTLVHKIKSEDGIELAVALHHELLVFASGQPELEGVLLRRDRHGQPSLLEHPEFKAISRDLSRDGQPLMGVFVQPAELANLVVRSVPPDARRPVRETIKALQLNKVPAAGYAMHVRRGEFHDYVRVAFPEPRSGLLATLLTGSGDIDRQMSRMIPPDVVGFSLISMSVPQILEQILQTAGQVDPMSTSVADGLLANLKARSGVDLREDLLSVVGNQILTMQWEGGEWFGQDLGVVVNLHDSLQFQNAWETLQPMVPMPIKAREVQGHRVYQHPVADIEEDRWPVMTIAGNYLVIASGQKPFQAILSQMDDPRTNDNARNQIANLPAGTFLVSWVDLARSLRSQLAMVSELAEFDQDNQTWQTLLEALDELAGTMKTTARRDARGVEFRAHSPIGNAQSMAMVSIGAAIALPNLLAARAQADLATGLTRPRWDTGMTDLMRSVAGAQQEFKRTQGEYGTFGDLIDNGLLAPESLGVPQGNGFFSRDGHLIALFVPTTVEGRQNHYVAVAWPDQKRTGLVYGSIPSRPSMANDLIAAASGIQRIDPRDIFVGGDFTAGLVAGWRDLGGSETQPVVGTSPVRNRTDADLYALFEAEEKKDHAELARLLTSENPDVAARAAHVLGNLHATDAVPELCDAVTNQTDLNVRLQAMEALNKIRDPRSRKASTNALSSENVHLRALAAANLGKLRDPDSVQPLLNMISNPDRDEDDTRDRVQALLALNDIGRPECLLPAAAAETSESEKVEQALTYLFQNLSPKLPPEEEVSSLMAVLDHHSPLLRRYSIQRLGELKDKNAVRALEGRLAVEGESLQPLIHVALDSIRGTEAATPARDVITRVKVEADKLWGDAKSLWGDAKGQWATLSDQERLIAKAGAGGFLLLLGLLLVWRSRRRRKVQGAEMAAMVAPSDGLEPVPEQQFEDEGDEYTEAGDSDQDVFAEDEGELEEEPVPPEIGAEIGAEAGAHVGAQVVTVSQADLEESFGVESDDYPQLSASTGDQEIDEDWLPEEDSEQR